jgi:hypothetical protein
MMRFNAFKALEKLHGIMRKSTIVSVELFNPYKLDCGINNLKCKL